VAFAAEAIAALGNGVAAEIGQADAWQQSDPVFQEERPRCCWPAIFPMGAHPFVVAKTRVQMGHRLPGMVINGQTLWPLAGVGRIWPIA
jgi:hypothetical protein